MVHASVTFWWDSVDPVPLMLMPRCLSLFGNEALVVYSSVTVEGTTPFLSVRTGVDESNKEELAHLEDVYDPEFFAGNVLGMC